jgi:predicted phosphodiesterase
LAKKDTVLVISDTHFPEHNSKTFDFLSDLNRKYKPTRIVHIGDEIEWAALSFHDKDPRSLNACDEYAAALKCMKKLFKLFPNIDFCESNHGARHLRVAFKAGLPPSLLRTYREIWEAPEGARWHKQIVIDDVLYKHGDPYSGRNAAFKNMSENFMSLVQGHTHSHGGVGSYQTFRKKYFHLNVGCLINPSSHYFDYASKINGKPTLGSGVVIEGVHAVFEGLK